MKTTANKRISGAAYVGIQADLVTREGALPDYLAVLFFQCPLIKGQRTVEEWDTLVNEAHRAQVMIQDVVNFHEEDEGKESEED